LLRNFLIFTTTIFISIGFVLGVAQATEAASGEKGVGILGAAKQAGFSVNCPAGAANCYESKEAIEGQIEIEAERYSTVGIQVFILKLLGGILNFAAVVAVVMLVVSGLRLATSAGNQDTLQSTKKQIIWIFAGLAVIILSLLIVQNITETVYKSTMPSPECNNGKLEEGEQCDGSNLGGKSAEVYECSDCKLLKKVCVSDTVGHGKVGEYSEGCKITCDEGYKLSEDGRTCKEEEVLLTSVVYLYSCASEGDWSECEDASQTCSNLIQGAKMEVTTGEAVPGGYFAEQPKNIERSCVKDGKEETSAG